MFIHLRIGGAVRMGDGATPTHTHPPPHKVSGKSYPQVIHNASRCWVTSYASTSVVTAPRTHGTHAKVRTPGGTVPRVHRAREWGVYNTAQAPTFLAPCAIPRTTAVTATGVVPGVFVGFGDGDTGQVRTGNRTALERSKSAIGQPDNGPDRQSDRCLSGLRAPPGVPIPTPDNSHGSPVPSENAIRASPLNARTFPRPITPPRPLALNLGPFALVFGPPEP